MKNQLILLLLSAPFFLFQACSTYDGDDDSDNNNPSGDDDTDSEDDYACPSLTANCPSNLQDIGTGDSFAVDSLDVTFKYSEQCEASYAPIQYYNIPSDIKSLSVTVELEAYNTGFAMLEMDGETIVNWSKTDDTGWYGSPHFHWPNIAGTIVFPANEDSDASAGCLAFLPIVDVDDVRSQTGTVHIVSRRGGSDDGKMDINVVVADGAGISQEDLEAAVDYMAQVYAGGDSLDINTVNYYTVTLDSGPYIDSEGEDINTLRATSLEGDGHEMNFFFIADFVGSQGILGMAAGIPGPIGVNGTAASGVTLSVESHQNTDGSMDIALLGETMAHEAGHQMGLFHTTESSGEYHDGIGDTDECPPSRDDDGDGTVDAEECEDLDGHNFMFWIAASFRQDEISQTQAEVLTQSPISY